MKNKLNSYKCYRLKAPFQFQHRSEALHFHKLRAPWHTLPIGLRVTPIPIMDSDFTGKYWLEEFPPGIFPPNSIYLHDAEHYGIVIPGHFVEEVTTR
jgi:hypothetical protein